MQAQLSQAFQLASAGEIRSACPHIPKPPADRRVLARYRHRLPPPRSCRSGIKLLPAKRVKAAGAETRLTFAVEEKHARLPRELFRLALEWMCYPDLVALIDQQLTKLFQVRALLFAPDGAEEPETQLQPVRAEALPIAEVVVVPRKVRSSLRGMTKRPRTYRRPEPAWTALRGAVPAGPVAVAPEAARAAQTAHQPVVVGASEEPP